MKRDTHRLAAVLRVRHAEEAIARAELARRNGGVREAIDVRAQSLARYRIVPCSDGVIAATVFHRERGVADLAAATLSDASRTVSLAEAHAALALRQWREAAQRVEALERLEQRRLEEARAIDARREYAAVDDLVASRFVAADPDEESTSP